jgi:hypothetical protein
MEKSLGVVLFPSRGRGNKNGKSSKNDKSSRAEKAGKFTQASKGNSKVPKIEQPAQTQLAVPAMPSKVSKGQPRPPVTQMGMQVVKMQSPAISEAAEMCVLLPMCNCIEVLILAMRQSNAP